MKPLYYFLCTLLLTALACSTAGIAENLVPSGGVLFQDYFDNPQSGWGEMSQSAGTAGYIDGAYHIIVNQNQTNLWTHPGKSFTDVRTEVSVMNVAGPLQNRMGLVCRLKDDKNFYFFSITADGFFAIGKIIDGNVTLLGNSEMMPSNSVLTGNQINIIRADCKGNQFAMYVNNELVSSVTDDDLQSGDIGIFAGSFDQTGSDVYFDNFVVTKP